MITQQRLDARYVRAQSPGSTSQTSHHSSSFNNATVSSSSPPAPFAVEATMPAMTSIAPAASAGPSPPPTAAEVGHFAARAKDVLDSLVAYDFLGVSARVAVLDVDVSLGVAFVAALETKSSCCLLWNRDVGAVVGVMAATEYVRVLLHCHEKCNGVDSVDELRGLSIREWLQRSTGRPDAASTPCVVAYENQQSGLEMMNTMQRMCTGRLPVLLGPDDPTVCGVLTYRPILAHLVENFFDAAVQDPVLDASVCDLGIGCYGVAVHTVTMQSTLVDAFRLFLDHGVHVLPIVDPNSNVIIDVLSRNDVLGLEAGTGLYDLSVSLHDVLQGRVTGAIYVYSATDTFRSVVSHFVRSGTRTLLAVDGNDRLFGVVTLGDIFSYLSRVISDVGERSVMT
eukprot:PhM_4_TR1975/c0_g1_i1/m.43800/K07200/PRKAG; 5'-AMP-activated protein kinase, regulatory gamma subunit